METEIGCVIMASGLGKRFGGNKLLCDFHGRPMIACILDATACFHRRVVVTRHDEIVKLCTQQGVPVLLHTQPRRRNTIRLGLQYLLALEPRMAGCMFAAADQPRLQRSSVENLQRSFQQAPEAIHRLSFEGQPGNPVIFPKSCFEALLTLPPDVGGRHLLQTRPEPICLTEAGDARELWDADTPEMLQKLL